jgi:hypothetical protein
MNWNQPYSSDVLLYVFSNMLLSDYSSILSRSKLIEMRKVCSLHNYLWGYRSVLNQGSRAPTLYEKLLANCLMSIFSYDFQNREWSYFDFWCMWCSEGTGQNAKAASVFLNKFFFLVLCIILDTHYKFTIEMKNSSNFKKWLIRVSNQEY